MAISEKVVCNLCGSSKTSDFLTDIKSPEFEERFTLVECAKCSLKYINPRPKQVDIGKYYATPNYYSERPNAQSNKYVYNLLFNKMHLVKGKILDIGAGSGYFLSEFKRRGWSVKGIEPSLQGRKMAKKNYNIILKKEDLLKSKLRNNQFDLITLNNVIEHLHQPKETLAKASRLLKIEGLLLVSCPNIDSFGANFFTKNWYGIDAPRHLYQFSPRTLRKLLKLAGFEVIGEYHNNFTPNYNILFESFRRTFSSNSSKVDRQKFVKNQVQNKNKLPQQSIPKKISIVMVKFLSALLAYAEGIVGRGEAITVVARKK